MASEDATAGRSTYLLDADSDGGCTALPGTVALARCLPEGEPHVVRTRFTGGLRPWEDIGSHVAAIASLLVAAGRAGADRVHVDTPGFEDHPAARRWLAAFLEMAEPDRLIHVAMPGDEHVLPWMASFSNRPLETVPASLDVVRKSAIVRATRRCVRIAGAFEDAPRRRLALDRTTTIGSTLGTGTPMAAGRLAWLADALGRDVLRAEILPEGTVCAWTAGSGAEMDPAAVGWVAEALGAARLRVVPVTRLRGRIAAWINPMARHPVLLRIVGIDPRDQSLVVDGDAPTAPDAPGVVRIGRFRVDSQGTVRPCAPSDAV
ncbi:MAG: hypothetical protein ACKO5K_15565 [Armatimonadota bacterium]